MVKNIAVDLSWIKIDKSGGVENHTINLIKSLNKKNIIFFVTPEILKNKKYIWLRNADKKVLTDNYLLNIFYILFFSFFYLKEKNITKFFSTNIYCPIVKPRNLRITITLHHAMWLIFPEYYSFFKKFFFNLYYRVINQNVSYIAISNHIKNKFEKKFNYKNIKVIYNPIIISKSLNIKKKFQFENKKYFFYLAAKEEHKNIDTIIDVFRNDKIRNQYNLVVAGYKHDIKKISKNIFFMGKISEKLKSKLFKESLSYIHPSTYEGFGMPLVEALMFKKKIITTKGGAIPEITSNMCIYVKNPKKKRNWIELINKFNSIKFPKINLKKINKKFNYDITLSKYQKEILNDKK